MINYLPLDIPGSCLPQCVGGSMAFKSPCRSLALCGSRREGPAGRSSVPMSSEDDQLALLDSWPTLHLALSGDNTRERIPSYAPAERISYFVVPSFPVSILFPTFPSGRLYSFVDSALS
ncbi:hypothetical protein PAXRUDRAFT_408696 [Paxillus rubicundulus Ve08.2h10]|uniref:Unplaced genomic scaffold scaffold_2435, whole genome shotgun sequence n=1 Tax=Paxillus rubicundulus Ve08.2h10 TaxID=930991 RepID=A0A0D0DG72_9AGAM|nr:hypothetical protein PAXRUDRAFT_408696 [Paxillus rubicundulus Ve08.2h10]